MRATGVAHPHFAFEFLPGPKIVVSYQGNDPPEQHEVLKYNQLLQSVADDPAVRCLWYTQGPRPSLEQQERLSATVPKHQWLVALLSPSPDMRFVASAFSLVNKNLRYFTPQDLPRALRHLQCTSSEQAAVQTALAELKASVETEPKAAALRGHP